MEILLLTAAPAGQVVLPGLDLLPHTVALTVDGGIDADTAGPCAQAGATLFVAGSAVFGSDDPVAAYRAVVDAAGAT